MTHYHILSLKHSPYGNDAAWWRSNDSGYTSRLGDAGIYSQDQIDSKPNYYNNGETTVAIPVDDTLAISHNAVSLDKALNYLHERNPEWMADALEGRR